MFAVFTLLWVNTLLCSFRTTTTTWRYYPVAGNNHGYFTTRTKFMLEYIGSTEWHMTWYHHKHCQVENKMMPQSIAQCFTAGYHEFGILNQTLTPEEVKSILVIKSPYCYKWQMKPLLVNSSTSEHEIKFQLLISKISEVNVSSVSSSEFSTSITKIFHEIGLQPSVSAFYGHSKDEARTLRQKTYFSENNSVWEVEVTVESMELVRLRVDGPPIAFLDCFIKPMVFELEHPKIDFAAFSGVIQPHLSGEVNVLTIVQDDCAPSVIAIVSNGLLLLTQNYFVTVSQLIVPQNLLKDSISSVNKVVFSRGGNLLIHTGVKTFMIAPNASDIAPVEGLRDEKLKFSSYLWCHQDVSSNETFTDVVLAWNNQSLVYISLNPTIGFTSLAVPSYFASKSFRLLDVQVNGICLCVYFLVELSNSSENNDSKVIAYIIQDYKGNTWGNITTLLEEGQYSVDSSWSFQFLPPNTFSLLLWNSWDVFYKGAEGEPTTIITKQGNMSTSGSRRIVQVATSNNGEYVVLYESNVLYFGRIGMNYMIRLHSRFPEGQNVQVVFDLNGYLRIVSLNKSTSSVVVKNYPLDSEIFNNLYPSIDCPFMEFSFGSSSLGNTIDKWENFQIWAYLVYKRSESNDIQLVWNPSSYLQLTISEQKEFYGDVIMLNKTFIFTEESPINTSSFTTSFSATIHPKLNSMICKRPFHKVFHFHVGCPPSRRAVIRDARSVSTSSSDIQSTFSLQLQPDEVFQPVLLFYDADILFGQINSSFELTEVNGREGHNIREGQKLSSTVEPATISFGGTGTFQFLLSYDDQNTSFCSVTLEFSIFIEEESEPDYVYIVEIACVVVITTLFIKYLAVDYLLYRSAFLQRHEEDDDARSRVQELQYLAQLQYFRKDATDVQETKPVSSDIEDLRRRAALVTGKSERRSHRRSSVFERVSKGVFEDLKVPRRPAPSSESTHDLTDHAGTSRQSPSGDVN